MKRIIRLVLWIVPLVVLTNVAWPQAAREDEGGVQSLKEDVNAASPMQMSAVVHEFRGKLSMENITAQFKRLINDALRQKIDASWEGRPPVGVLILYEDPTGKENFKAAIGLASGQKQSVKPPLKAETIDMRSAVRTLNVGPPDQLERAYRRIQEAVKASGKGNAGFPVVMQLLDDPNRVKPELVRTIITVPIQ